MRSPCYLLLATALLVAATGPAWSADLYVNPNGLCGGNLPCYTTIQAAINAASAGDVIHVQAATYPEVLTIPISLTLQGAGAASTFINSPAGTVISIGNITANVTIDGFTITTGPASTVPSNGISISNVGAGSLITITNNVIVCVQSPAGTAFDNFGLIAGYGSAGTLFFDHNTVFGGGDNPVLLERWVGPVTFSYNTIHRGPDDNITGGKDAIFVMNYGATNITAKQIFDRNTIDLGGGTIFDNAHRGTGISVVAQFTGGAGPGGYTDVEITNNQFVNLKPFRRGCGLWDNSSGPGDITALIKGNTVSAAAGFTGDHGIRILGGITGTVVTENDISGVNDAVKAQGWNGFDPTGFAITGNSLLGVTMGVNNLTAATADASANWWGSNAQAAVAAAAGATTDYTPWLDVNTDTSANPGFQGSYSTLHVDDASPQVGATGIIQEGINLVTASTVLVGPGTYGGGITLNKTVNLLGAQSGVAACGRVPGPPNPAIESVISGAAPGSTLLTLVAGCAGSVIDGFSFIGGTRGIESTAGPLNSVQILNNHVAGFTGSGLFLNDSGLDMTISQNNIDGTAQTGGGGLLHLDQDNFDGMHITSNCIVNGPSGTGLFVDGNHNVGASVTRAPLINGNTFGGNTTGANLGRFAFEYGTISNNQFASNLFDGLQGGIQNSTISGNIFIGNGRSGLALTGFGGATDPTRGAQNTTVSGNMFTANVREGVFLSSGQFPGTISTNTLTNNNFVGNGTGGSGDGVAYAGTETIAVTCNWWGHLAGPDFLPTNPNPPADDLAAASAIFWPWLNAPAPGGSCNIYGLNNVAPNTTGLPCLSTTTSCVTVPIVFNRADTSPARGATVTFTLSPNLELCGTPATSILQGGWLAAYGSGYQVIDNGGGNYTVDQAILGQPCGVATGGTLFTVAIKKTLAAGDGTGTITVNSVSIRDCGNPFAVLPGIPGAPGSITIDTTPPAAIADLATAQKLTGNDANGTTKINLTYTSPATADSFLVWRKGFGFYPEYDDAGGAAATLPVGYPPAGWTRAYGGTTAPTFDEPATRDYWYYVVYTKDLCGNVSLVSNMTPGTLNYHLGDVTNGSSPGTGDNLVGTVDITLLGNNYGINLVPSDPFNYLDVGPTTNNSTHGRPLTDNRVNFEDLLMFAINYGTVSLTGPPELAEISTEPRIALTTEEVAGGVLARLVLSENANVVKGIHALVEFASAGLVLDRIEQGDLLAGQAHPVFFRHLDEGAAGIHAALLGNGEAIRGSGEVARLYFRGHGTPTLTLADMRDIANGQIGQVAAGIDAPAAVPQLDFALHPARPNPFNPSTVIGFALPEAGRVDLAIYDVRGRLVRMLVEAELHAGEHTAFWDGRDARGASTSSGIYIVRLSSAGREATQKIQLMK